MTQPDDDTSGSGPGSGQDNEHTNPDLHGTAREVAEGKADEDGAPTPGGG